MGTADVNYNRYVPGITLSTLSSLTPLLTLNYTALTYKKTVILSSIENNNGAISNVQLTFNGITIGNINPNHGIQFTPLINIVDFQEINLNQSYPIVFHVKTSGNWKPKLRITAFGVKDWTLIKQNEGEEVTADSHLSHSKNCLQYFFYPKSYDNLIISYGEIAVNDVLGGQVDFDTSLHCFIDNENDSLYSLSKGYFYSNTGGYPLKQYNGVGGFERLNLSKDQHRLVFQASKLQDSLNDVPNNYYKVRRMRAAIISLEGLPFGVTQSNQITDKVVIPNTTVPGLTHSTIFDTQSYVGRKHLVISNIRINRFQSTTQVNPNSGYLASDENIRALSRYNGLGLTGLTLDLTSHPNDLFDITVRDYFSGFGFFTYNTIPLGFESPSNNIVQDKDTFSTFKIFSPGIQDKITNDNLYEEFEHQNQLVLQFEDSNNLPVVSNNQNFKEQYNVRTLIEINKEKTISRYALEQDIYLFPDKTALDIITYYQENKIDKDSLIDLVVTGEEVVESIEQGYLAKAQELLKRTQGLPEGITVDSEYNTFSSWKSLYKKSLLKSINIKEDISDEFFGIVNATKASFNFSNEFIDENTVEELIGSVIKVKEYDLINNELKTKFIGKITDIEIGSEVIINALDPSLDILDTELPKLKVTNIKHKNATTVLNPDEPETFAPIFFGRARRLLVPNIDKSYGTEDVNPDFVDAYSDYIVGGPILSSAYPYVIPEKTYSKLGLYRNWIEIIDKDEFNNTDNIVELTNYIHKGNKVPYFRFQAKPIVTKIRTGLLPLPHINADKAHFTHIWPNFVPVTKIVTVEGYREGVDYQEDLVTPSIDWSNGAAKPLASTLKQTTQKVIRGSITTDSLIADPVNSQFVQPFSVVGITQDFDMGAGGISQIQYTKFVHFTDLSSNPDRAQFEDIIDWNFTSSLVANWKFEGNLNDSSSNNLHLTGQDNYNEAETGLEWKTSVFDTSVSRADTALLDFNDTEDLHIRVLIQSNNAGLLKGHILSKLDGAGTGYGLGVVQATTVGGSIADWIARAYVSNGSTFRSLIVGITPTDIVKLNDGAIHTIDLFIDRSENTANNIRMHVDNNIVASASEHALASFNLSNTASFLVGGANTTILTTPFEGCIHEILIRKDAVYQPPPGSEYWVKWNYRADTFRADWEYQQTSASNPIQANESTIFPIAIDAKVSGVDVGEDYFDLGYSCTIPVVGSTYSYWTRAIDNSGYALRLNSPEQGSGWVLGQGQLGIDTQLGSNITGDGTMESTSFGAISTVGQFSVYACAVWRGEKAQDSILMSQDQLGTNIPQYALGMKQGKAYAQVYTYKNTIVTLQGFRRIDNKVAHLIHAERTTDGYFKLYVNGNLEAVTLCPPIKSAITSPTTKFRVGSKAVFNNRWQGDVLYLGQLNFAGTKTFSDLMLAYSKLGIKGAYVQEDTNINRRTIFHIPFTEGTGDIVKPRNLHQNFGLTIKRLLSDKFIGLGEDVDSLAFDKAITLLDDLRLKCDFIESIPKKTVDILKELLRVRGIILNKDVKGRWRIKVDNEILSTAARFGYGDGYFNNIIKVDNLKYRSIDQSIKEVKLNYRQLSSYKGDVKYFQSVSRTALPFGNQQMEINMPYILEHQTADKVVDYIAKKLRYTTKTITITVGKEGRYLNIGDVIELTIPLYNISKEFYKIRGISYNLDSIDLDLESFSNDIFTYSPGPLPKDEEITINEKKLTDTEEEE